MRIAFISTILNYPWGGADTLWTRAAEAACARGDAILLCLSPLTAAHPRIRTLVASGCRLHLRSIPPEFPSFSTRLLRSLRFYPPPETDILRAVRDFAPELVIFSQGGTYDLLMHPSLAAWLRACGVPYRVVANWQTEHPTLSSAEQAQVREALLDAELLAFVSRRNLEATQRHLLATLPRARVLHNPLREDHTPQPWPGSPELHLATVSRLDPSKGIHLLLHALAESTAALPPWRLEIFGIGPQESVLREIIAHLGLGVRATLRGHVGSLREIWANNHLLCAPALDDGVPMTIPEAMLCARPVLSTRVGGAEDWIEPDHTGFLCPAATVPLLREALVEAARAFPRWTAMGAEAREAAIAIYRPDDYLQLLA